MRDAAPRVPPTIAAMLEFDFELSEVLLEVCVLLGELMT